jgi:hypothetical protein
MWDWITLRLTERGVASGGLSASGWHASATQLTVLLLLDEPSIACRAAEAADQDAAGDARPATMLVVEHGTTGRRLGG